MFDDILMTGFNRKFETYNLPTDVRLLACDKFVSTHQLFAGMCTGVWNDDNKSKPNSGRN
jgi:hypothetical protein